MFEKFIEIAKAADFHWKDVVVLVFIGMCMILLTDHIFSNLDLCK